MSQTATAAREPLLRIAKREGTTMQKIAVRAIAILLALVVDALFIFFRHRPEPTVRLWRHVERYLRQHDPLQLDAARPVHAALRRHRAGPGLQDALLELRRRGPDPDRRPDCRPHHGVSGQQSAAAAAVCRHGAGQHCRGRTVGLHPRVVQVPLEHERDAVHPDDELRCYVHCCLHDQHHARPGIEPRHAEQGDQGRLVPPSLWASATPSTSLWSSC